LSSNTADKINVDNVDIFRGDDDRMNTDGNGNFNEMRKETTKSVVNNGARSFRGNAKIRPIDHSSNELMSAKFNL
jgi:hypothetical protein